MKKKSFITTLSEQDWDNELGGWHCSALSMPDAVLENFFASGKKIDNSFYSVMKEHNIIRWAQEERPQKIKITIKFNENPSKRYLSTWKRPSILLPAFAIILSAFITGIFTYISSSTNTLPLVIQQNDYSNSSLKEIKYNNNESFLPFDKGIQPTTAIDWETLGFKYLLEKKINSAYKAFIEAKKILSTHHCVEEIAQLIDEHIRSGVNWRKLYKKILSDYSFGMPPELEKKMREIIKTM